MMLLLRSPLVVVAAAAVVVVVALADHNPTGASVNLINAINDSVVVHCWSRESDLGSTSLSPGLNFYWSFHPNIFGRTVFKCNFLWKQLEQEFAVWKGSYHSDRLLCCAKGPCTYKICPDGFYNAFMVDSDYGTAESWEFYQGWVPRFNPEAHLQNEGQWRASLRLNNGELGGLNSSWKYFLVNFEKERNCHILL